MKVVLLFIAAAFALIALISYKLFPYYSTNNDEAVYVFQGKMLAEGKLYLSAQVFGEHFASFYNINDGYKVYPKYTPVFGGMLALSQLLFHNMHILLALIAGANVAVIYHLGLEIYHRKRIAALSALFLLLSPLFTIQSSLFLPYMFTLLLTGLSLLYFIKALRSSEKVFSILAGVFIGIGFFNRPYDAMILIIPLGVYGAWLLLKKREHLSTFSLMALAAAPFVITTLVYNYGMTGNPFVFPFNLYETRDTLGFGEKRLGLGMETWVYTPAVAMLSTRQQLGQLGQWVFGGPLLPLLALVGVLARQVNRTEIVLLSIAGVTIIANFFQWGNLISIYGLNNLGPFYYINIMFVLCLVGGRGFYSTLFLIHKYLRQLKSWMIAAERPQLGGTPQTLAFMVLLPLFVITTFLMVAKINVNYIHTKKRAEAYAPILSTDLGRALVFLPTPYGPFLGLPFGYLTNSPSLDNAILYARNLGNDNLKLFDAMPERKPFTFFINGIWTEKPDEIVKAYLKPIKLVQGKSVVIEVEAKNPTNYPNVTAYIWHNERTQNYLLDDASSAGKTYKFRWQIQSTALRFETNERLETGQLTLSTATTLNVALAFSESIKREVQDIYEFRFWFDTGDRGIRVATPGEQWIDIGWPSGQWVPRDVSDVLKMSIYAEN